MMTKYFIYFYYSFSYAYQLLYQLVVLEIQLQALVAFFLLLVSIDHVVGMVLSEY